MAEGATIAAVLTGSAAVLTAWAAVKRAQGRGTEECEENLTIARQEAEKAQARLHEIIMRHPEEYREPVREPEDDAPD